MTADLDRMLGTLDVLGGSDLHLRAGCPPRVRLNGELVPLPGSGLLDADDMEAVLATLLRPHVAGRFAANGDADVAYTSSAGARFRAHAFRQRGEPSVVLRRVLDEPRSVEQLRLPAMTRRLADEPRGLVLVCGPTGSGKTSTLAAMVDHINRTRRVHIVTIEDPIEILHRDRLACVSQREIGIDLPDYATGMRAVLREDPDVIAVGEMRDRETVVAALTAAETGHLVLSSLHTTDAAETVNRIVELFPDDQRHHVRTVLAATLKGTICQRLVPSADGSERVPATEVMVVNGRIRRCITEPGSRQGVGEIVADSGWYGMQTFDQSLASLYEQRVIDLRQALSTATNPHDLLVSLRGQGLLEAN